ncbi:hypothetical protein [Nocardia rhizosphaerae]|uniref:Uncharacterized protein n=1 Tax=Nocardia rhizosphaerae TaxID=1691571 RepID=A0ABV8L3E0_9NOCA
MKYQRPDSVLWAWAFAGFWFALCIAAAILGGAVVDSKTVVLIAVFVGAAPFVAVFNYDQALEQRHDRLHGGRIPMPPMPVRPPTPVGPPPPQLPPRLQGQWNRLTQAWNVVTELQHKGWVDADSTRGLPDSMNRLYQLGVADGMTDQLGGRRSGSVEQQIGRLADLLVALADEAVEHQATLGAGDFTPATIAAAAQRLSADRAAYRELMELSGTWHAPPGRG